MHPTVQVWGSWTWFVDYFYSRNRRGYLPQQMLAYEYAVLPRAMEGDHEQHHLQWEPRHPRQMFLDTGGIGLKVYAPLYGTLEIFGINAKSTLSSKFCFVLSCVRCVQSGCGNKWDSLAQWLANCRSIHGHERHHSHSAWGRGCDTIFRAHHATISYYILLYLAIFDRRVVIRSSYCTSCIEHVARAIVRLQSRPMASFWFVL
jgi:hypothetical protein